MRISIIRSGYLSARLMCTTKTSGSRNNLSSITVLERCPHCSHTKDSGRCGFAFAAKRSSSSALTPPPPEEK